jgi:hypothetical protein
MPALLVLASTADLHASTASVIGVLALIANYRRQLSSRRALQRESKDLGDLAPTFEHRPDDGVLDGMDAGRD